MIITYYGKQFIRVQLGDVVLAFNPIGKDSKFSGARFGADIVLSSLDHPDLNGIDTVTYGGKEPFAITGPGEYELSGVYIKGFAVSTTYGGRERLNTVYIVSMEQMTLVFLGALHSGELSQELKEALDEVDILFIPVGGEEVLPPDEAQKLANKLGARIVIPMDGDDKSMKQFLKEAGAGDVKPTDKATLKKKDIEGKEGEVIVLKEN
ncbi:MAG: MBL fold metallo-hydrolase [Candidatus Yonathbacteria bacterium]|nr:MBL fold metallo-hydrolase [Candidatus Yonathbacteria bacterium]